MGKLFLIFLLFAIYNADVMAQKKVICHSAGDFHEGMAAIQVDEKWGFIDTSGNVVIAPQYIINFSNNVIPAFSEGLAAVLDPTSQQMIYINKKGEIAFDQKYIRAYNFHEGIAFVEPTVFSDFKVLINKKGENITERFRCSFISDYSNNRARIDNRSFIDRKGKRAVKQQYTAVQSFSNGLAAVQMNYGKWGFIDTLENVKVPFQFTHEPKSFSDYRAFVQGSNNKWGVIDTTGNLIVEPVYNQVFPFSSGIAVVSTMDNKWKNTFYLIDINGKVVREYPQNVNNKETITILTGFNEGYAVASKGYKKGFIDTKGNVMVNFLYRDLRPMSGGMAYFEKWDEKTKKTTKGFIDKTGKEVIVIEQPKF
jgi:hypothetical protein